MQNELGISHVATMEHVERATELPGSHERSDTRYIPHDPIQLRECQHGQFPYLKDSFVAISNHLHTDFPLMYIATSSLRHL